MLPTRITASVFCSVLLLAACREAPTPPPAPAPPATSPTTTASALTRVTASSLVCMVNDRYMGSDQIPVTVEGKTYYGCCAGCKDKLQNNAAARTALDPVSRQPVDKATALIGRTSSGKVLYFESEQTFARYRSSE